MGFSIKYIFWKKINILYYIMEEIEPEPSTEESKATAEETERLNEETQQAALDELKKALKEQRAVDVKTLQKKLSDKYIEGVREKNPEVADSMKRIADALETNSEVFKEYLNSKESDPSLPDPLKKEDIERFNKYNSDSLQETLNKLSESSEQLKKLLKKYPIKEMTDFRDLDTYNKNIENINKIIEEMDFKELEENAKSAEIERINKDGIEAAKNKPTWKDSIKKNLKWLLMLLGAITAGVFAVEALISYAQFHSGCQFIECKKDELPVSNKVWCSGTQNLDEDGVPQTYDIFTSSNDNLFDYNSSQCACAPSLTDKVKDCNQSLVEQGFGGRPNPPDQACCTYNSGLEDYPSVLAASSSKKCYGDANVGPPYGYYYWGIMTPLDAAGNIGNGVNNYVYQGAKWLVKLLVIVGVVVGVIILLLIIYQYFKNKHPAQAIKVETGSAISKFGNSSYFGNLSRYSNYAYMGRCAAFPAKPYLPLRFKF